MSVFFVTRHKQAVLWAAQNGLYATDLRHIPHLDMSEVAAGDVVFGTLPLHLAAELCGKNCRYIHLTIEHDPASRGRELTREEMDQRASLQEFDVCSIAPLQIPELYPVNLFVARHESTQAWGRKYGQINENTKTLADLDVARDVNEGDVVAGTLPPNVVAQINAKGARYLHLGMNISRDERGSSLSEQEVLARGFQVMEIKVKPVLKRTNYRLPLKDEDKRPVFMVCITSGQNLPNVIACAEFPLVGLMILVTDMEGSKVAAQRISNAVARLHTKGRPKPQIHQHEYAALSDAVGEGSLYRSMQKLKKDYQSKYPNCRFIANLTGGTKPMSLELSHLAERLGFERIYCETEQAAIRVFDHRQSVRYSALQPFRHNLNFDAYFETQGYRITKCFKNATDIFFPSGEIDEAELKRMYAFVENMVCEAQVKIDYRRTQTKNTQGTAGSNQAKSSKSYHSVIHEIANGFFEKFKDKGFEKERFKNTQIILRTSDLGQCLKPEILDVLQSLGLAVEESTDLKKLQLTCPNERIARFIKGIWFEFAFALALENALEELKHELGATPRVQYSTTLDFADRSINPQQSDVQELDVIVLSNNLLHVFELKAGWSFLYEGKGTDYKGSTLKNKISGALGTYQIVVASAAQKREKDKMAFKRLTQFNIPVRDFTKRAASMNEFNNWVKSCVLEPILLPSMS